MVSRAVGVLTELPMVTPLNLMVLGIFIRSYRVNQSEITKPLRSYKTFRDFFVRELPAGARPIESEFVSPIDGTLRNIVEIQSGHTEIIKGQEYLIEELIEDSQLAREFENGRLYNFYLAPGDYHHVHAPAAGKVNSTKPISGNLWPVNDFSYKRVPKLFSKNERVVINFETDFGQMLIVLVGAMCVGKIKLVEFSSNQCIGAGEKLATFYMGSSVILITKKDLPGAVLPDTTPDKSVKIKIGNTLI